MPVLTIGRVGLEVDLNHPAEAIWSSRFDQGKELVLRGFLTASSTTNARYLRNELIAQQGRLIAVTYTGDDLYNGFYILSESRIDVSPGSHHFGGFPYEVVLIRIGSDSRTELQSLLTGNTVTNAHTATAVPWLAFPAGALAVNVGDDTPTEFSRTGAAGQMNVLININRDTDPTWSVSPSSYYSGSVKLYTQGLLRAGLDLPKNDPADWSLENDFVRIRPSDYQGTSDGELDFFFHNGTSWSTTPISFHIDWDGSAKVSKWHFMTPLWNEPEEVRIRLKRDAETAPQALTPTNLISPCAGAPPMPLATTSMPGSTSFTKSPAQPPTPPPRVLDSSLTLAPSTATSGFSGPPSNALRTLPMGACEPTCPRPS
jgi:hypothetical protein